MSKFDEVYNNSASEYELLSEAAPWDNLKKLARQTSYAVTGAPAVTTGWNNKVDAKNVYTLNVEPKTKSEQIIAKFMSDAGISATTESFDEFMDGLLEASPHPSSIYDPKTLLPIEGKEGKWKNLVAKEIIDARRADRGITITSIINRLQGKRSLPSDITKNAVLSWVKDAGTKVTINVRDAAGRMTPKEILNRSPYTERDLVTDYADAERAFMELQARGGDDEALYKYYWKLGREGTPKSRELMSPEVIEGVHNLLKDYFSKAGLYYLTPAQYKTMKEGRWRATKDTIGRAIKSARDFGQKIGPTVKFG